MQSKNMDIISAESFILFNNIIIIRNEKTLPLLQD